MTLTFNIEAWFKVTARPLPKSPLWLKQLGQGKRIYRLDKDFTCKSAMTLSFDQESWFKIIEFSWTLLNFTEP